MFIVFRSEKYFRAYVRGEGMLIPASAKATWPAYVRDYSEPGDKPFVAVKFRNKFYHVLEHTALALLVEPEAFQLYRVRCTPEIAAEMVRYEGATIIGRRWKESPGTGYPELENMYSTWEYLIRSNHPCPARWRSFGCTITVL